MYITKNENQTQQIGKTEILKKYESNDSYFNKNNELPVLNFCLSHLSMMVVRAVGVMEYKQRGKTQ